MRKSTSKRPSSGSSTRSKFVLVLDIGTTGVKALAFDRSLRVVTKAYQRLAKPSPKSGWVEQRPQEIVAACRAVLREAVAQGSLRLADCLGVGITNQRETTILWDRKTGRPVYPAIVWEDRRTRGWCVGIRRRYGEIISERTGLVVDSYFSASKIRWILDHVALARQLLANGRLAFGTVDTWLLWNLCEGHPHLTDDTNAARTLLYDIRARRWSREMLGIFGVPEDLLPEVRSSRSRFGVLDRSVLGVSLPVLAVCGDQQSSLYAALRRFAAPRAATKVTMGTGTFVAQVLGSKFARHPGFFTTLAPGPRQSLYALESKIEGSAATVDHLLGDTPALIRYLAKLAAKVDVQLKRLPVKPKKVVIDGGIIRDGLMKGILAKQTGLKIEEQVPYDGTGLGTALLAFEESNNPRP
jgi:glycerol kinase